MAREAEFTAVFKQEQGWWIGWIVELPGANVQERTLDEARESIREAIQLIVATSREMSEQELAGEDVITERVAVAPPVKRGDLIRHPHTSGCVLAREGSKHAVYVNPARNKRTTVPWQAEVVDFVAWKVCKDLGIPEPGGPSR